MPAAALPAVAAAERKMRTVSGEAPAVVQRPDDSDRMRFNIAEQHGKVYVAVMEVMQMQDIRPEALQFFQQPPGREPREAAVQPGQPRGAGAEKLDRHAADDDIVLLRRKKVSALRIGAKCPISPRLRQTRYAVDDASGASYVRAVYEYDGFQYAPSDLRGWI